MATVLDSVNGFSGRCGEILLVDPRVIKIREGWNARTVFDDLDTLMNSIIELGVLEPLKVRKLDDNTLELVKGERRLRATLMAIENGHDIKTVKVIVANKKATDAELFFEDVCSNTGTPLSPTDEAAAFKRFIGWGYTPKEIAVRTNRSESHVRNRLDLAEAAPDVKAAVVAGEIPVSKAQEIVKKSAGNIEKQKDALEKVKQAPKTKRLVLRIKDGNVMASGYGNKNDLCDPLFDVLDDHEFQEKIKKAGFNPESIKITIEPVIEKESEK